ncbi:MAG TPA: thioredoxin family protein [Ktedonobacterales bacterium]|nr:thioredoxin family protein [Ktedonobacterales bacterium]
MAAMLLRLGVLALVSLTLWLVVWGGRRLVEARRQAVLNAAPAALPRIPGLGDSADAAPVHILNFSSADCSQCFRLQAPALRRLLEARSGDVTIVDVDAPNTPELAERYQVLTVPTTVVLDASGQAQAVNFGFAPTERLLKQVDAVLAKSSPTNEVSAPEPAM